MAKLSDVKQLFPEAHFNVTKKEKGNFLIKVRDTIVTLPEKECDDFFYLQDKLVTNDLELFLPGYFEHLVEIHARGPRAWHLFGSGAREIEIESSDELLKITVSPLSYLFILGHFLNERFYNTIRRFGFIYHGDEKRRIPLHELCSRFVSIKISVKEGHKLFNNKEALKRIVEAGLFNISFNSGVGISLSNSWDRVYFGLNKARKREFQFPSRIYLSDLVAYYQMAIASDNLVLSYLSLYRVLEHFFLSTTEKVLHKRMADFIVSPDFSHKKTAKLRELATLIRKFDQKMGEQQMLTTVIENYFMVDEIVDWVNQYETQNEKYYTLPQIVFDETHTLDINPDKIYSSLSKRIYHIRNVLVHSKEGEMPKFVPFSGQETVISKEIQILLFLAESIIVKSGIDY